MTSPDDEFDDFLQRRRPVFGRDDELEPPLELDRVVLRQAREAIEGERRPHRMFRAPSWGMPAALAATLVLAFTIILRVGTPEVAKKSEVTVQNVSRPVAVPEAAAPAAAPAPATARTAADAAAPAEAAAPVTNEDSPVLVDLGTARERAETPRVAEQRARRADTMAATVAAGAADARTGSAAATAPRPPYRRDAKAWLAEIERLRSAGESARADAELAEYKREHRAYAAAPDR